jgi:hypothetical protein
VNVFFNLADLLILEIVLFPTVLNCLQYAGISTRFARVSHMAIFGITCVFMVVFVTLWDLNDIHTLTGQKLVDTKYGNSATFETLYLIAALSATFWLFRAAGRSRSATFSKGVSLPMRNVRL